MSVLELKQEYERQLANPPRRFERPQDIAKYINEHKPDKSVKATVDLTVYTVRERDLCWHLHLIANSDDDFEERKSLLEAMDEDKQSRDRVSGTDYVPGKAYAFANVKDLHVYFGVAQGSLQASAAVVEETTDEPKSKQKRKATKDSRI